MLKSLSFDVQKIDEYLAKLRMITMISLVIEFLFANIFFFQKLICGVVFEFQKVFRVT